MINARMGAEEKLVIQEMMADLNEMWHLIDRDRGPSRGGITNQSMQTDFLRWGKAGNLFDARTMIKKAKVQLQMVIQSQEHEPERWQSAYYDAHPPGSRRA